MPCGDVAELAPDHERELVLAQIFEVIARKHERIRLAETDRRCRNQRVLPYENQGKRNSQRGALTLDDRKDLRVLRFVNQDARADQSSARERDKDHRADDEERDLGEPDGKVNENADDCGDRERPEQR